MINRRYVLHIITVFSNDSNVLNENVITVCNSEQIPESSDMQETLGLTTTKRF